MGKRNCANPGWNTIQCETGYFTMNGDTGPASAVASVTFSEVFPPGRVPSVTLMHSASYPEESSHMNIYLAEVTTVGFVVSSSIESNSGVHWQAIAMW